MEGRNISKGGGRKREDGRNRASVGRTKNGMEEWRGESE